MGNGNRAQQKRERNAAKDKSSAKSQLKNNEKAMNIQCKTCLATFFSTTQPAALTTHAENKHSKTLAECFPDVASKQ